MAVCCLLLDVCCVFVCFCAWLAGQAKTSFYNKCKNSLCPFRVFTQVVKTRFPEAGGLGAAKNKKLLVVSCFLFVVCCFLFVDGCFLFVVCCFLCVCLFPVPGWLARPRQNEFLQQV